MFVYRKEDKMGKNDKFQIIIKLVATMALPFGIFLFFVLITQGRFYDSVIIRTISRQSVIPILIAMALSFDMIQGTWDFSAGSVVYASAIIGGNIGKEYGVVGIFISCIAVSLILCLISGILYTFLKIPAIVLSIGLLMIYEAFPRIIFNQGVTISMKLAWLGQPPYIFVAFLVVFVLYFIIINYSQYGYNIRAIGSGQEIAASAGVNISTAKFVTYLIKSLFLGVAGALFLVSNIRIVNPDTLSTVILIFEAMMGVFIALFIRRYSGFAIGIVVGIFSMKMLTTAMVGIGMSTTIRSIVNGLFLLILLVISSNQPRYLQWRKRINTRKKIINEQTERSKSRRNYE